MRTVTTVTHVYTFDELSADAQVRAIESLRDREASREWDSYDIESITATMIYNLADKLRTPGWDTYGEGDFPGIDGVKHNSWSLDRDRHLALSGHLDRDNAPGLPWVDGIGSVTLIAERHGTTVDVNDAEANLTVTDEQGWAVEDAVTDAIDAALRAAEAELEYKTSAEYAREVAEGHEYTEDGHLCP